MQGTKPSKGLRVLTFFLILFALATLWTWVRFIGGGNWGTNSAWDALLFADAYMSLCSLLCAVGILRRREWGLLFGLLAGGAITFLGLFETFYVIRLDGLSREWVTCVVLLIFGPVLSVYLWKRRSYLITK